MYRVYGNLAHIQPKNKEKVRKTGAITNFYIFRQRFLSAVPVDNSVDTVNKSMYATELSTVMETANYAVIPGIPNFFAKIAPDE